MRARYIGVMQGTDVAHSVVCVSVCLSVGQTELLCKTAELIEMPSCGMTVVGPRNHVLDGVQISLRQGHVARLGDMGDRHITLNIW